MKPNNIHEVKLVWQQIVDKYVEYKCIYPLIIKTTEVKEITEKCNPEHYKYA